MLHKMSQLVSIVLTVVILVLPLSACLTPAAKMSLEELRAVAFPKLSEAQMAALGQCPLTKLRKMSAGETLFAVCDRSPKIFVVRAHTEEPAVRAASHALRRRTVTFSCTTPFERYAGQAPVRSGATGPCWPPRPWPPWSLRSARAR